MPGVELRIVDLGSGEVVPSDGETFGEIQVRGPWITGSYYNADNTEMGQDKFMDGWFRTGDVATIDPEGYMQIIDRTKDLVKSGGEWISSVTLENDDHGPSEGAGGGGDRACRTRSGRSARWRASCRSRMRGQLTEAEIIGYLEPRVAKWWLPDDVIFIEAIPKTSVGKFDKKVMRAQMAEEVKLGE